MHRLVPSWNEVRRQTSYYSDPSYSQEKSIVGVRAGVYYFQNGKYEPVDGGLSYVHLYHNAEAGTYRVVAISQHIADKVSHRLEERNSTHNQYR